ncbi:MAG: hypothetical protein HQL12_00675 [Candidatus Omnitrophica bacterium]|nr:hypothetical protein [Candidatus Omnitrophota bacterium]
MFSHKGSVLLMTMIMMVCLTVLAVVYLNTVMLNSTNASAQVANTQALYLAEAGINKAIYYLTPPHAAPDGSTNGTWRTTPYPAGSGNYAAAGTAPGACVGTGTPTPPCQESLDAGVSSYTIWVVNWGDKIQITSAGTYNGLTRTIQVRVTQPSGLMGWWKFDEGTSGTCSSSGTPILDSSGNGNNGACHNNPAWYTGHLGAGALSFNGVGQFVTASDSTSLDFGTGDFSISCWIYLGSTDPIGIVNKMGFTGNYQGYALDVNEGLYSSPQPGALHFKMGDGTIATEMVLKVGVTALAWQHVAVTVHRGSATGINLYLNGGQVGSSQSSSAITGSITNTATPQYIGLGTDWFYGYMDDLRVYNRALSSAEIAELYTLGTNGLPMIEGIGPSVIYGSRQELQN